MSITKIKRSLLRSVISFMREICMCHCEKRIFFSLEMNRNSLHLHSGGPMRHIRSHLSKLQWLRSSHCFANAKQSCSTLSIISSDSEFPSTRCVNHCSFHSSRVVTHLNCNCPIGKFASCLWSRVEFRLFPTLRVGIRKANRDFLHLNMRNHNRNPTSIWTRKIIQQWVNVANIETVPRSSSSNRSHKPRIEAVKPCRGTRMSSNASSPTHKLSCAHQVLQWNCHLADQT